MDREIARMSDKRVLTHSVFHDGTLSQIAWDHVAMATDPLPAPPSQNLLAVALKMSSGGGGLKSASTKFCMGGRIHRHANPQTHLPQKIRFSSDFGHFIFKVLPTENTTTRYTSKTPYVAIDERGLVRSIHLFLFSCVH